MDTGSPGTVSYTAVASTIVISTRVPLSTKERMDRRLNGRTRTTYLRALIEADLNEGDTPQDPA